MDQFVYNIIISLLLVALICLSIVAGRLFKKCRRLADQLKDFESLDDCSNLIPEREEGSELLTANEITLQDELFIERLNHYLEYNYSNMKLNIDDIALAMGYSRVQLYRKVKSICGESPNQLLKNLRLRKGDELLRTSGQSISEVAYQVGFTSPSYFSKNYKGYFGVSPRLLHFQRNS